MAMQPFTVSKFLTYNEIHTKPSLPTEILQHIPFPQGTNFVDLQVKDLNGKVWTLRYYTRPGGDRVIPVFTVGWRQFVATNCLEPDDKLTIYRCQDGELQIQTTRKSNVTYQGEPVYLDVENFL